MKKLFKFNKMDTVEKFHGCCRSRPPLATLTLTNAKTSPNLPEEVKWLILANLPMKSILNTRLVNKSWNNAFKSVYLLKRCNYVCDGSSTVNLKSSCQALLDSSLDCKWQNLTFRKINLEAEILGTRIGFLFFTRRYGVTLKSLTLSECQLPMGRFIELMAYCDKITQLTILDSPSIFNSGFEITYWAPFYQDFFLRLKNLQELEITDGSGALNENTLLSWLAKTKSLTSLKIHTGTAKALLPQDAIVHGLKTNVKTLRVLNIQGRLGPVGDSLWGKIRKDQRFNSLNPSQLETLTIYNSNLKDFSKSLLVFKNLKTLKITQANLAANSFLNIHELRKLECFEITKCYILPQILQSLAKVTTLKSITFADNTGPDKTIFMNLKPGKVGIRSGSSLIEGYINFFKVNFSPFEKITFSAYKGAQVLFQMLDYRPYLKYLDLSGTTGFQRYHLNALRCCRESLQTLKMSGCDLNDEWFRLNPPILHGMTALEVLNLSNTSVGDLTITQCVVKCKKLTYLDVTNTIVSASSLQELPRNCEVNPNYK